MLASVVFIVICDGCDWPTSFCRTAHALGCKLFLSPRRVPHPTSLPNEHCSKLWRFFCNVRGYTTQLYRAKNSALRKIPINPIIFQGITTFFLTNAQISMLRKSNTLGVDYFISKGGQATFEWPLKDVSSVRVECIRRLGMSCFTFKLQLGDRGVMEASLHDNNNILHDTALPAITIFQWKLESLQNHPFIFKGPRLIFHWTCQPRRPIIDRMESLCWMHCLWTIGAFRVHPKVSAGVALSSRLTGGRWQYLESPIGFLGANQSYPTKFWLAHLIYLKKVDTFKNFRLESQDVLEKPRCETQPFKWDSVM